MPLAVRPSQLRTVTIDPFGPTVDQVGTWSLSILTAAIKNGYLASDGTQNNYLAWDVLLSAGTWKFGTVVRTGATRGILSVQLDAVEVATLDMYSASTVDNVILTTSGFVVASTGMKRLRLKIANKNASASGYTCLLNTVQLVRTA